MLTQERRTQIIEELHEAGVTSYALTKFNSRYLPTIIHDGERIMAVVYGRYHEGGGFLNWVDRMFVATDRRVISLNHKPGYTDIDEFTYDIIAGVTSSTAGPFTAVTLHTRMRDITVRFVNAICAEKFTHYIEVRQLEHPYKQF